MIFLKGVQALYCQNILGDWLAFAKVLTGVGAKASILSGATSVLTNINTKSGFYEHKVPLVGSLCTP